MLFTKAQVKLVSSNSISPPYMTDYNNDGAYEEDSYAVLAGCEKDNIYTFQADGSEKGLKFLTDGEFILSMLFLNFNYRQIPVHL